MKNQNVADIAIIGAGIVGLAHAYLAHKKGFSVVLFEREEFAVGASVRNFGLIWPIGQRPHDGLEIALHSRTHWLDVASQAGLWINPNGSLHLAYHQDEWDVLNEFASLYREDGFEIELLNRSETLNKSGILNPKELVGSLWSKTECTVNPRQAIRKIPLWLQEKWGLQYRPGQQVQGIALPYIETSQEKWKTDKVIICSGAEFQTLYPEAYQRKKITKCKLQMMKAKGTDAHSSIGPSLCGGLTLRHYPSFKNCPSLPKLDKRYDQENLSYKEHGIHVLLSQNNEGDFIIGDSHAYGLTHEPFDSILIDSIICNYLRKFVSIPVLEIKERWHGIYSKLHDENYWVEEVDPNVTIVNGLGGAGMTLSFGVAEKVIEGF